MDQPEQFPEMVAVLDTDDNFALGMATLALSEAGIIYDTVDIPDLPANLEAQKSKWWIPPTRIFVSAEDAKEALLLMEPFNTPRSHSDIEEPDRKESVSPDSQFIWKRRSDAPFVQRVGARLLGSFFICIGLSSLPIGLRESSLLVLLVLLVGAGAVFLGVKMFLHGLPASK
jgi:hypothetical protein